MSSTGAQIRVGETSFWQWVVDVPSFVRGVWQFQYRDTCADVGFQGFYTKDRANKNLDVVIVEASAITEDGGIICGASVGASPELIQMADKVCWSVHMKAVYCSCGSLHDIFFDEPQGWTPLT